MPRLADIQAAMRAAVLGGKGGEAGPLAGWIEGGGLDPVQRVAIHRNNTMVSLIEVLEANFPVVRALVGGAFFTQAARAFARQSPPRHPILTGYGDRFADFLSGYGPASGLAYLPDVARLEWARLSAQHAAQARPVPQETLDAVPPHLFPMARCGVHPSFRFVVSAWPVDRIWAMHQPDWPEGEAVSLDGDPATVLLCRSHDSVRMARADQGTLSLLFALEMGQTLETAAAAGSRAGTAFNLTAALGTVLSLGLLIEVAVPRGAVTAAGGDADADGLGYPVSQPLWT